MNASNDTPSKGFRAWWRNPPRSGLQLIISPIEYRHLRGFGRLRIVAGIVLVALGLTTLSFGGTDAKTYAWTMFFLAVAAAALAHGFWDLRIARSTALDA